jgi:hypothetical protein
MKVLLVIAFLPVVLGRTINCTQFQEEQTCTDVCCNWNATTNSTGVCYHISDCKHDWSKVTPPVIVVLAIIGSCIMLGGVIGLVCWCRKRKRYDDYQPAISDNYVTYYPRGTGGYYHE